VRTDGLGQALDLIPIKLEAGGHDQVVVGDLEEGGEGGGEGQKVVVGVQEGGREGGSTFFPSAMVTVLFFGSNVVTLCGGGARGREGGRARGRKGGYRSLPHRQQQESALPFLLPSLPPSLLPSLSPSLPPYLFWIQCTPLGMTSFSVRLLLVPGKIPPPTGGREGGRDGGREGRGRE